MNGRWRKNPHIPIMIHGLHYALAGLFLASTLSVEFDFMGFGTLATFDIFCFFVFGLFASAAIQSVAGHYAWQRITSCDFNVCPCCEYALRGLPASAQCPECGELNEREKVQAHWKECFATAAKTEACLRLSPLGMRQYTRYSIWLFVIAGICFGVGISSGSLFRGWHVGSFSMLAALAILCVQAFLLPRIIARLYKA